MDNNIQHLTLESPCESNLKILDDSLIYKTPSTGFSIDSVGQYQNQNQKACCLAICLGHVSASECKTCVSEAPKETLNRCPYNKGAVIWYKYCMLKYLDNDFSGKDNNTDRFYMWNLKNACDPATFNYKTRELLSQFAQKAYVNPKLFATGEQKLQKSETLYGLTQCTRDLSSNDCKKCLDDAINELPHCCDG